MVARVSKRELRAAERHATALVRTWQTRLGLDHWDIEVVVAPLDGDMATIRRATFYDRARLTVAPWVLGIGETPDECLSVREPAALGVAAIIAHELLHLVTAPLQDIVDGDLEGEINARVHGVLCNLHHRAEEQTIDRLAVALTRAWPEEGSQACGICKTSCASTSTRTSARR